MILRLATLNLITVLHIFLLNFFHYLLNIDLDNYQVVNYSSISLHFFGLLHIFYIYTDLQYLQLLVKILKLLHFCFSKIFNYKQDLFILDITSSTHYLIHKPHNNNKILIHKFIIDMWYLKNLCQLKNCSTNR